MVWFDQHRKCSDGSQHEGRLELMTWEGCAEDGQPVGFGGVYLDEADELKHLFDTKYKGNEARFYGYWPQGFRWTCCGMTGDCDIGCDHHGAGSSPCRCDFCHMGKPLPADLYPSRHQPRLGLSLSRGPDPRSYDPMKAGLSEMMRGLMGMDIRPGSAAASSNPFASVNTMSSTILRSPAASALYAEVCAQAAAEEAAGSSSSSRGAWPTAAAAHNKSSTCEASVSKDSTPCRDQGATDVKCWTCQHCGVSRPIRQMKLCSACKAFAKAPYCSRECFVADWPKHKAVCQQAQRANKAP